MHVFLNWKSFEHNRFRPVLPNSMLSPSLFLSFSQCVWCLRSLLFTLLYQNCMENVFPFHFRIVYIFVCMRACVQSVRWTAKDWCVKTSFSNYSDKYQAAIPLHVSTSISRFNIIHLSLLHNGVFFPREHTHMVVSFTYFCLAKS